MRGFAEGAVAAERPLPRFGVIAVVRLALYVAFVRVIWGVCDREFVGHSSTQLTGATLWVLLGAYGLWWLVGRLGAAPTREEIVGWSVFVGTAYFILVAGLDYEVRILPSKEYVGYGHRVDGSVWRDELHRDRCPEVNRERDARNLLYFQSKYPTLETRYAKWFAAIERDHWDSAHRGRQTRTRFLSWQAGVMAGFAPCERCTPQAYYAAQDSHLSTATLPSRILVGVSLGVALLLEAVHSTIDHDLAPLVVAAGVYEVWRRLRMRRREVVDR